MTYQITELSAADVARLRQLLTVFGEAFDDFDTYQGAVPSADYLRSFLQNRQCIVLAGVADGRVVGGLVAYEFPKFERERKEIYIYDLAVLEAHRRKGIARGLIERLKLIAGARGAYVIYVQADRGDEPAIALYTALGSREDVLHFDIAPNDRESE